MKSYQVKHVLPNKALLLSMCCLLPFAALGIYMDLEMQTGRDVASIPFIIGTSLAFYFLMFYVEKVKVIQLSDDSIISNGLKIKMESINSFKLKDDSPEFIYLKIFTNEGQILSIGTRTNNKLELLSFYEELKKTILKHNKLNHFQIKEEKLIYDSQWGKIIGIVVIGVMAFTLYEKIYTDNSAKSLGGFFAVFSGGAFLLYRIFRKNNLS